MPIETILSGARVPVKVWTGEIEDEARKQLTNTANLPFVFHHVAAMPDVHLGKGATVGSVVATEGAICPAAVGVDIGCGMVAQKTTVKSEALSPSLLRKLRSEIERSIPVGFRSHSSPVPAAEKFMKGGHHPTVVQPGQLTKAARQLGTLGGGNHFIEVCEDRSDGKVWLLLHSGSRNIGKSVAEIHIDKAKGAVRQRMISLPDPDLAYFLETTPEFQAYLLDLEWCQKYALVNREVMMDELSRRFSYAMGKEGDSSGLLDGPRINCHHNYVSREHHFGKDVLVTRKGAIRARQGDLGIIPGSMGTGTYIVRGLGNPESFDSAPHGAGRRMSRSQARKRFTREDLCRQTEGIECRKDQGIVDEIPSAYKDIQEVMKKSSDLVEVVASIKPLVCVKG